MSGQTLSFSSDAPKICVLRLSAIGDVCHAVAVVQQIQKRWPRSELTWVVGTLEWRLLEGLPGVNFVVFDKSGGYGAYKKLRKTFRAQRFDVLLHMQVALRASLVSMCIPAVTKIGFDRARAKEGQWLFTDIGVQPRAEPHVLEGFQDFAALLDSEPEPPSWQMPLDADAKEWARVEMPDSPYVVISAAASKAERNWLPERYAAVAECLCAKGFAVVLCGGPAAMEKELARAITAVISDPARTSVHNFVGKTNLKQLLSVLHGAKLVIAPDTGPAHMAVTVGTPVVGLYAHSNPRRTGPYLYQQVSPYAHLISGGKATVAKMFVNNANGQRGLVCQYDVVCFDEVSGISFDSKDGVNIMKGYMESGEFSRGKESIRGDGSMVFVGNFDVDVEHQQRVGHLFGPLPDEMRDDTAWMDRIHCYLPGWNVPKMGGELLTDHFGLVSDFLSECMSHLRNQSRVSALQGRVYFGGALSGRDTNGVNKTISGLLKLLSPDNNAPVSDEDLEWAVRQALESRRRVKEQQKRIGSAEFRNTHFSYIMGDEGIEKFVATPELQADNAIGSDPLEPGQIWAISEGGTDVDDNAGLYRIEINEGPGSGVKILNNPVPAPFRESVRYAEQNLYSRTSQLVGDRDPRSHEFTVQLRAFDSSRKGAKLGVPALVAMCSSMLNKPIRGGLILIGEINLGGSIEPVLNAVNIIELAVEKGAQAVLLPVGCRRQLMDLSDDMATKIDMQFYADAKDAMLKALVE